MMDGSLERNLKMTVLFLIVLSLFIPFGAAASDSVFAECTGNDNDIGETLACMFTPGGEGIAGPQELMFGIVLPFLIVFAILFYGAKQVIDSEPEAFVIALCMSAFIIPSGGYRPLAAFLYAVFGLGGVGLGGAGGTDVAAPVLGIAYGEIWRLAEANRVVVSVAVGIIMALYFYVADKNKDGEKNVDPLSELPVVGLTVGGVYLALGGGETLLTLGGLLAILFIGYYMLGVARADNSGALGKAVGFVGIMVIGWFFLTLGEASFVQDTQLADFAQQFGTLIFQGAAAVVFLLFLPVIIVVLLILKWYSVRGGN